MVSSQISEFAINDIIERIKANLNVKARNQVKVLLLF